MCSEKRRVIFHIDVNSAFLSWEAVYRLRHLGGTVDLRQETAAVGGDISQRHGIILAKSLSAKKYGIRTGESIPEALRKCPDLLLVPPNYGLYQRCSQAFLRILREYSPAVEQFSIDEAFVDMTGTDLLWGDPVETARKIAGRIRKELGFTVNIGVSSNKLLAKMASDFEKPDRVHTLFPEEVPEKMWPLPVGELFLVGRATLRQLHLLNIHTIGQLAKADPVLLRRHLKKQGETIRAFANGQDVSLVREQPEKNKGYGNSTTIAFDVQEEGTAKMVLLALAETVGMRLRRAGVQAEVLTVAIKSHDLQYATHQMTLPSPTSVTCEIHQYACRLFDELWDGRGIRLLGIHAGRLCGEGEPRQLNLFDTRDYSRAARAEQAVDGIRRRYGPDAVKRAVFVGNDRIDHLLGGISREKRTVDYRKLEVL